MAGDGWTVIVFILDRIAIFWDYLFTTDTPITTSAGPITWGGLLLGIVFVSIAIWGFKKLVGLGNEEEI